MVYRIFPLVLLLAGCGGTDWQCVERGKTMYSVDGHGNIGTADKGCSCIEIAAFEKELFGRIDYQALKEDFGCDL